MGCRPGPFFGCGALAEVFSEEEWESADKKMDTVISASTPKSDNRMQGEAEDARRAPFSSSLACSHATEGRLTPAAVIRVVVVIVVVIPSSSRRSQPAKGGRRARALAGVPEGDARGEAEEEDQVPASLAADESRDDGPWVGQRGGSRAVEVELLLGKGRHVGRHWDIRETVVAVVERRMLVAGGRAAAVGHRQRVLLAAERRRVWLGRHRGRERGEWLVARVMDGRMGGLKVKSSAVPSGETGELERDGRAQLSSIVVVAWDPLVRLSPTITASMPAASLPTELTPEDTVNLDLALAQARKSLGEGGVPIGAVVGIVLHRPSPFRYPQH